MILSDISSEYGITKSIISSQIKDVKEIKVDENEVMTLKEVKELKMKMARTKEENEILKKLCPYKMYAIDLIQAQLSSS